MVECPACHTPNAAGARFCAKCGALLPAAESAADPLIGNIVGGRFRILSVLGEGGMGRVYNAEQQMGTNVRKVAVKTLLSEFARDPQVVARFMRECGTISELEHPNTIKVYDFGQTPSGDLYIAMELLSGQSLESALEKGGAMAPERVDAIIGQVCGSLQEAHDKGIVHRDLKPPNIYLTKRGNQEDYVKVLDFGIAKRDERKATKAEQKLTQQGTVLGTPPYMSPEQFKGGEIDHRSDIYSLGILTYEMLTGRLPFEADNPWQWATQHMTAQPYPFEATQIGANVPPKMRAAVMRALDKDPARRPQSATDFHHELTMGAALPRYSMVGGASMLPQQPHHGPGPGAGGTMPGGAPILAPQPVAGTMVDHARPVPTGGGTAMPAPAAQKGSSAGPILAVVALLLVGGGIGGYFAFFRDKHADDTAEHEEKKKEPEAASTGTPAAASTGEPSAQPTAPASSPPPPPPPTQSAVASAPAPSDTASAASTGGGLGMSKACELATKFASSNQAVAIAHYKDCKGLGKGAAAKAIEDALIAKIKTKGCAAKGDVSAAAATGITKPKAFLPANCR